jgi:hypothetical protein
MPPRTFSTAADERSVSVLCSRERSRSISVPPVITRTPSVIVVPLPPTRPRRRRRFERVSPKLRASWPTSSSANTRGATSKFPSAISLATPRSSCSGRATSRESTIVASTKAAVVRSITTSV